MERCILRIGTEISKISFPLNRESVVFHAGFGRSHGKEYDYFYDYADFTLKPIVKPTTTTTTTTTTETIPSATEDVQQSNSFSENSTQPSSPSESTTNSIFVESTVDVERTNETTETALNENPENSTSENHALETNVESERTRSLFSNGELSTEDPSERLSVKRYRSEYSPDEKGRCHRLNQRRLSLIPLVMRLSSKLLDDLTHNAKNSVQGEDAIEAKMS
ncbi:probable serine/threonine-protein kinase irlD isoform X3 [Frieseomelitta varia]|uniref:probable serine/threonine-protein kinase irlD isoform X3 n=1 Tax=Frieseomelitta varia TaxID=561572 RepID=UPI001CB6B23F|nr:probable serine/threonine-protein kinase irlD isoform X3 [Frieseomelitta varia]